MPWEAQAIVNRDVGDFDVMIGIMWKHFGTPTGAAGSGTEEEFQLAYDSWRSSGRPRIMFYFSEAPYAPRDAGSSRATSKGNTLPWQTPRLGPLLDVQRPGRVYRHGSTSLVSNDQDIASALESSVPIGPASKPVHDIKARFESAWHEWHRSGKAAGEGELFECR